MSESDAALAGPPRTWGLPAGLTGLLAWLVGGVGLEALHAVKSAPYLQDPVRRMLWTLAHAHGTLLSALTLLLVLVVLPAVKAPPRALARADRLFTAGSVLVPLGFLLGGAWHPEGDPGAGILLVPAGALACAAALGVALACWWRSR